MSATALSVIRKSKPPMLLSEYEEALEKVRALQSIDEGKSWDERSQALAAWAKIYHDDEIGRQARRLRLHAYRRIHELAAESGNVSATLRTHGFSKEEIKLIKDVGRASEMRFRAAASLHDPPTPNWFGSGLPRAHHSRQTFVETEALHVSDWTLDRHKLRTSHYAPDPKHVAHLRAGIQEFREMLEAAYREKHHD